MSAASFKDLMRHVGHKIAVVTYSGDFCAVHNVAVECETCYEVLMDFDNDELVDKMDFHTRKKEGRTASMAKNRRQTALKENFAVDDPCPNCNKTLLNRSGGGLECKDKKGCGYWMCY